MRLRQVASWLWLGFVTASIAAPRIEAATNLGAATNFCRAAKVADDDSGQRAEASFNYEAVSRGLDYLKNDLPRALRESARTEDVLNDESHSVGYPNIIMTIEGYILRERALLRKTERDLVLAKSERGRASKAEVAAANHRFADAKRRFCDFLKSASYVD